MKKEEVIKIIEQFECGMFADRNTMTESRDYATMLLNASGQSDREFSTMTALTVHQNTMAKVLKQMINELDD